MRRGFVIAALLISAAISSARADTIVLLNGDRFEGEVHNKRALHLNPLRLRELSISHGVGPDGPFDFLTFNTKDIDQVILETTDARDVIDFTALRAQVFEPPTEGEGEVVAEPVGGVTYSEERRSTHGAFFPPQLMIGAGFLAFGIGVAVKFGEEDPPADGGDPAERYNAANYVLIAGGIALVVLGSYRMLNEKEWARRVVLERTPTRALRLSLRWGF